LKKTPVSANIVWRPHMNYCRY